MKKYFVICRETCSVCGGEGVTCPHEQLYEEFAEFCRSIHNETMHDQVNLRDAWMAERGYPYGSEHWPPGEVECHQCRGDGFIESRVELKEAISDIRRRRAEDGGLNTGHKNQKIVWPENERIKETQGFG